MTRNCAHIFSGVQPRTIEPKFRMWPEGRLQPDGFAIPTMGLNPAPVGRGLPSLNPWTTTSELVTRPNGSSCFGQHTPLYHLHSGLFYWLLLVSFSRKDFPHKRLAACGGPGVQARQVSPTILGFAVPFRRFGRSVQHQFGACKPISEARR